MTILLTKYLIAVAINRVGDGDRCGGRAITKRPSGVDSRRAFEALPRLRTVSPGRARLGRGVLYDRRLFRRVVSSKEPQARFDDITNDERSASERYRVRRWLRPTFGMGSVASFTSRSENVVVAQVEETTSCTRCSSSHVTAPSVDRRTSHRTGTPSISP
jgi:hypothetical protein